MLDTRRRIVTLLAAALVAWISPIAAVGLRAQSPQQASDPRSILTDPISPAFESQGQPQESVIRVAANSPVVTALRRGLLLQEDGQDSSPSDAPPTQIPGQDPGNLQFPSPVPQPERVVPKQESLTPEQSLELSPVVSTVDVSIMEIGTGVIPDPAKKYTDAKQVWLPDGVDRGATFKRVLWRPSLVFHNPLYFEDAMLERHGQDRWGYLQPLASGSKFLGEFILLPYTATMMPYRQTRYALGHWQAGTPAPILKDKLPLDTRAAVVEAAFMGGFFWAVPL